MINNKLYNFLKWVATIVLPASGALYFGLGQIWGFPKGEEVVGSLAVVGTFLGVVLGFSTSAYNRSDARFDGHLNIDVDGEPLKFSLDKTPEEIAAASEFTLRIDSPQ